MKIEVKKREEADMNRTILLSLVAIITLLTGACASSGHAIGMALWMLRSGTIDVAVTGGHEALLNLGSLLAWDGLRVVSASVCKPFTENRPGMILGEGGKVHSHQNFDRISSSGVAIIACANGEPGRQALNIGWE